MKQQAFIEHHRADWALMDAILEQGGGWRSKPHEQAERLPDLYRALCGHYALAHTRGYSPQLLEQLHERVQNAHQRLYRARGHLLWRAVLFVSRDFPVALRRHWRAFLAASLLFYLPAIMMGTACYLDDELILTVMDREQVNTMETLYNPEGDRLGRSAERRSDTDFMMFGYYIYNNTGIGFRTFATGLPAGIGSIFLLAYNGTTIGSVAGHLTRKGYTDTFWPFVSGHSAAELTAVCISGAAGLLLGYAVLAPGRRTRSQALRRAAREALTLMSGAALLFFIAAFIEAFWSSIASTPAELKYAVSAVLWTALIAWLTLAGKGQHGSE